MNTPTRSVTLLGITLALVIGQMAFSRAALAKSAGLPIPSWLRVSLVASRPPELGRTWIVKATIEAPCCPVRLRRVRLLTPKGLVAVRKSRPKPDGRSCSPGRGITLRYAIRCEQALPAGSIALSVRAVTPHDKLVAHGRRIHGGAPGHLVATLAKRIRRLRSTSTFTASLGFSLTRFEGAIEPGGRRWTFLPIGGDTEALVALAPAGPVGEAGKIAQDIARAGKLHRILSMRAPTSRTTARLLRRLVTLRYRAAHHALGRGDFDGAALHLARIDGLLPTRRKDPAAENLKAIVAWRQGDVKGAVTEYASLLKALGKARNTLRPRIYLHYNLAELHRTQKASRKSAAQYKAALSLNPAFSLARKRLKELP